MWTCKERTHLQHLQAKIWYQTSWKGSNFHGVEITKLMFRAFALRRHFPIRFEDDVSSISSSSSLSDKITKMTFRASPFVVTFRLGYEAVVSSVSPLTEGIMYMLSQCHIHLITSPSTSLLILCTLAYLQGLMAQNDGLLDGPGYNTTESSTMASCFRLLFSCLQYLFAWFVLFHDHN